MKIADSETAVVKQTEDRIETTNGTVSVVITKDGVCINSKEDMNGKGL